MTVTNRKPALVRLRVAAADLGLSPRALKAGIERGNVPVPMRRVGNSLYVGRAAVEAFRNSILNPERT